MAKAKADNLAYNTSTYIEWGIGLKTGLPSTVMVSDTDYGCTIKHFFIESPN